MELASLPLLLTLLCLAFDETLNFPENRADLYKEAIDALLKKWDASRGIERDNIYKNLSLRRKESLFSRIAMDSFEKGQYFFKQNHLEKKIEDFIQHLHDPNDSDLLPDNEIILKSIEAQHGILVERAKGVYSFSHLTIQEYFTAKYIVDHSNKGTLKNLVTNYIFNEGWREIFLLVTSMLDDASEFISIMKIEIDTFGTNLELQEFLKLTQNIIKDDSPLPSALCRAIALTIFCNLLPYSEFKSIANKAKEISQTIHNDQNSDFSRILRHKLDRSRDISFGVKFNNIVDIALAIAITRTKIASNIKNKEQLIPKLNSYFYANHLLIDCLRTDCFISRSVRSEVFDSLLTID